MNTIKTGKESRDTKHVDGQMFLCGACRQILPVKHDGGTGYGIDPETDELICYACCGVQDKAKMQETGKALLYLCKDGDTWSMSNWPGTLKFPVYHVSKSFHNFAGKDGRRDAYFNGPDGKRWHGVNIGDNQIARCHVMKS